MPGDSALRPEVVVLARRNGNGPGPSHDEWPVTDARFQLPIEASSMDATVTFDRTAVTIIRTGVPACHSDSARTGRL
jgi:hypothetical protein